MSGVVNDQRYRLAELLMLTWSDDALRDRLLSDTMGVLKDHGIEVDAGVQVKVLENTAEAQYIILPPKPRRGTDATEPSETGRGARACCPFSQETQECDLNGDDDDDDDERFPAPTRN